MAWAAALAYLDRGAGVVSALVREATTEDQGPESRRVTVAEISAVVDGNGNGNGGGEDEG